MYTATDLVHASQMPTLARRRTKNHRNTANTPGKQHIKAHNQSIICSAAACCGNSRMAQESVSKDIV